MTSNVHILGNHSKWARYPFKKKEKKEIFDLKSCPSLFNIGIQFIIYLCILSILTNLEVIRVLLFLFLMTLLRNKYRFEGKHKNKSKSYIVQVLFSVTEILRIYFQLLLTSNFISKWDWRRQSVWRAVERKERWVGL